MKQVVRREPQGLVTHVLVSIEIEGELLPEQRAELLKQAENCYIHRQLMGEWRIETLNAIDSVAA